MVVYDGPPIYCHTMHCLQMYSLYKDPSGEINSNFSNITTNLSGTHNRSNKVGKMLNYKLYSVNNHNSFSVYCCSKLCTKYRIGVKMWIWLPL